MRSRARRLIRDQQFRNHFACGLGALGLRLHLHASRWGADAASRQHALTFDLHHADAAIAVRPVTRFRRVAEMRQLDAVAPRDAENGLARTRLDLLTVECEGDCRRSAAAIGRSVEVHVWPAIALRGATGRALRPMAIADGFLYLAHRSLSITKHPAASSIPPGNTSARITTGSARPGRARRSKHRA